MLHRRMPQNVEEVYNWIVDDVVKNMNDVFNQEGIDTSVLTELRESWSRRLMESGVMNSSRVDELEWNTPPAVKQERPVLAVQISPTPVAPFHSLPSNLASETPTLRNRLAIGSPPMRADAFLQRQYHLPGDLSMWTHPSHTPYSLPGHGCTLTSPPRQQSTAHLISSSPTSRPTRASTALGAHFLFESLRGGNAAHPHSMHVVANDNAIHLHQLPSLTTTPSPQVRFSGKRKELDNSTSRLSHTVSPTATRRKSSDNKAPRVIPQHDGADDHFPSASRDTKQEQVDPDLDDDSNISDSDDDEESMESSNCLTAQYDKVSRIKNRWRCQLKHGIFHVDGRDYLFKSASGEFTF